MDEASEELPFEPHPLVALPRPVRPGTLPLPSSNGEAAVTGRLSSATLDTTRAIAEALFSYQDEPPPDARLEWTMDEYADFMARATAKGRLLFTAAPFVISVVAPLLVRRWPPFRKLPLPERVRALRAFAETPIGGILIALRALLCIVYYEHPDAARDVGITLRPLRPN